MYAPATALVGDSAMIRSDHEIYLPATLREGDNEYPAVLKFTVLDTSNHHDIIMGLRSMCVKFLPAGAG